MILSIWIYYFKLLFIPSFSVTFLSLVPSSIPSVPSILHSYSSYCISFCYSPLPLSAPVGHDRGTALPASSRQARHVPEGEDGWNFFPHFLFFRIFMSRYTCYLLVVAVHTRHGT